MPDRADAPMDRWTAALAAAARGERIAQAVWVGDSISELNWAAPPMPWQVGDLLAGRTEPVQYRNATADLHCPNMRTDARSLEGAEAGFGGRAVELAPGQATSFDADGEGLSVLWRRRAGGGELQVRWGDEQLGVIGTDGPAGTEVTTFARPTGDGPAEIELVAVDAPVRVDGIYVHTHNLHAGLRIWPAVRSGNRSEWFTEHRSWLADPLAALRPDLIVLATGTNDLDYEADITRLVHTVRAHAPDADIALWLPALNSQFTADRAAAGREAARREGCGVIDAAADLGPLPTSDGVHPTPFTVALCSAHAATVLGGPATAGWWAALTESHRALAAGQRWGGDGFGFVEIELTFGLATLQGKARPSDQGASWVLALPPLPEVAMGLPGPVLGMGPGGPDNPDTFLSRLQPGRFAVNGGRGTFELAQLVVRPSASASASLPAATDGAGNADEGTAPSDTAVALVAILDEDGRPALATMASDGSARPLSPPRGLEVPLPCLLGAHLHPTVPFAPASDEVVWVPMPALTRRACATRIWLEVLQPVPGARAAVAVTGSAGAGRPGLPGDVLAGSDVGAIDCGVAGMVGVDLPGAIVVEAEAPWWVAVHVTGGSPDLRISGAAELRAGAGVQLASPGAVPSAEPVTGAVVARGHDAVPSSVPEGVVSLLGPAPALHVSLEAPSAVADH